MNSGNKKIWIILFVVVIIFIFRANIKGYLGYHSIKYEGAFVNYNQGIGDEWSFEAKINNKLINRNDSLDIDDTNLPLHIQVTAIENDKHSDVGRGTYKIQSSFVNSGGGTIRIPVMVRETNGRGAGKTAEVEFVFIIR